MVIAVLVACAGAGMAQHHSRQTPRPPVTTPTASPTVSSGPAPVSSAAPSPLTPAPTSTSLIPQHAQSLVLTGALTGTVVTAEVKECGTGNGAWALELSSMAIDGGSASLTLIVNSYRGDGSYLPSGALNAIENQQLATFPVTGGSVQITDSGASGQINLTLTSSAQQQVRIQGTWACG